MGVQFFVDPEMLKDPSTRDVNTITLSYTMFRKPDATASQAQPGRPGS
jgi:cytochrome c oxidase assembly protein Cox11